jgi:hypothetical protein
MSKGETDFQVKKVLHWEERYLISSESRRG